jgi:hypothetical protein
MGGGPEPERGGKGIVVLSIVAVVLVIGIGLGILGALGLWPFDREAISSSPAQPVASLTAQGEQTAPTGDAPSGNSSLLTAPPRAAERFCAAMAGPLAGASATDWAALSTEDLKSWDANTREAGVDAPASLDADFEAVADDIDAVQLAQQTGELTGEAAQSAIQDLTAAWTRIETEASSTCG